MSSDTLARRFRLLFGLLYCTYCYHCVSFYPAAQDGRPKRGTAGPDAAGGDRVLVYESTFKFGGGVVNMMVFVNVLPVAPALLDVGVGFPRKVGSSSAVAPAMPAGLGSSDTCLETTLASFYGSSDSESDSYSPSVTYPPSIQLPPLPKLFKLFRLFYRVSLPPLALYTLLKPRCARYVDCKAGYTGCLSTAPLNTGITRPGKPAIAGGLGSILGG